MWSSSRNFLVHGMWLTHLLWIQGRDNSSQNAVNGCSGSMMPSCSFIILIRHWNVHLYENCLLSYGSFHHSKPGCVWSPLREVHRNKMTCTKVVRPFREGNGKPLQYSCLENPMDGGVWWAPFYGVAKSRCDWATSFSLFTFTQWRRKWQPTPVFLPGESQGQQSLVDDWSNLAAAAAAVRPLKVCMAGEFLLKS